LTVFTIILFAAIAISLIGFVVYGIRSFGQSQDRRSHANTPEATPFRPEPTVSDFHVSGSTASVVFAVPLGDTEVGPHLTDLLNANAVEYVRSKVASGLPLDGVEHIAVSAMRGDHTELIDTVDLPAIGQLPDESAILSRETLPIDPVASLEAVTADATVAPSTSRSDTLEPVSEIVELTNHGEAHLRSLGVDPAKMSLEDLIVGLFRINGYQIDTNRRGFTMTSVEPDKILWISRDGQSSVLVIVDHVVGSYPELDDQVLSEFAVGISQAKLTTAILVTDKFGPYAMYEREKRDKRLVCVTRERLQPFVDSFGLA
jgi:hypothetical protein